MTNGNSLTRAEWRRIGEAFERYGETGVCPVLAAFGICEAVRRTLLNRGGRHGINPLEIWRQASGLVHFSFPKWVEQQTDYWDTWAAYTSYKITARRAIARRAAKVRALFCYLMAAGACDD